MAPLFPNKTLLELLLQLKKSSLKTSLTNCKQISIADVKCTACKQLLFNPVVLNCGHVYCETCIIKPTNEKLMCQVCQCLNPGGLPKVCLELNQFLDEQLCKEYAARRDVVELTKALRKHESTTMCCMKSGKLRSLVNSGEDITWWADLHPAVHVKFGCDSCGMFPIIGERYKCIDCVEAVGFDLCGHCYHTRSIIPGRFNQQHTRLELVKPKNIHDMMGEVFKFWIFLTCSEEFGVPIFRIGVNFGIPGGFPASWLVFLVFLWIFWMEFGKAKSG
ncbi:E3 ubiquitin-protein ligase PRT1-like [Pistacia vera]|uniref:E3 ubiquitin-protein ligase PRT1-like n=1 Tax=Pistacia vera TaxID=55513 RepID=UPI001263390D|nr:E3 ubiquitin-protein ligase PRT1-like [Pistacia vera]